MTIIQEGFRRQIQKYSEQLHEIASSLDERQFWNRPFPYGNSFGHLVLHLTGNLNHYIGAHIAQSGYLRDREREFTDPNPPTKAEALTQFDNTIALVLKTIENQNAEDWARPYEVAGVEYCRNRFEIMLQCVAHIYHHIGQMIYLKKEWMKQDS